MENASKALIIAGSILISIVIISLGIMVVNNAKQNVDKSNLSEADISTFNAKFTSYCGQNKTANEMRSLVEAIITNNAAETQSGNLRTVQINSVTPTTVPLVPGNQVYTLTATYGANGLITNITTNPAVTIT